MDSAQIIIVDLGSQYTTLIETRLRELGVRSTILPSSQVDIWMKENRPKGVILSGGNASVYDEDAPSVPASVLRSGIPVLGICYGAQWLVSKFDGLVRSVSQQREYGKSDVNLDSGDALFAGLQTSQTVWVSHGDSIQACPSSFRITAKSSEGVIAAISSKDQSYWGIQFHPEVRETECGEGILRNFLFKICSCKEDWHPESIVFEIREEVRNAVRGQKVICGFSGGVDSTTLSALLSPVLGGNLSCICIDGGQLRKDELKEIQRNARAAAVNLHVIDASSKFLEKLRHTSDPEKKRILFQSVYADILAEEARKFGAKFVMQGSLAPDFIESGAVGEAVHIKSHHNIGLHIPGLEQLHPFRNLFKYEVRGLAQELGLPKYVSQRQPFPGPGLFVRVLGKPPTKQRLSIIRWADAEVTEILREHKALDTISQLVVALDCTKTLGIKGDGRSYGYSILVRAVQTSDFMTARAIQLPVDIRRIISQRIPRHEEIVRVLFDETDKPPATIEFE